jgi:Domain of unknown function (DUF4331)
MGMNRFVPIAAVVVVAAAVAVAGALVRGAAPDPAGASSHREAPFIAADPTADNTDVYAFRSPDRQSSVTLIANYLPFQEPAGGPNFFPFADDVLYAIHVDNDGDAREDVAIEFRFKTKTRNPNTFLYNTGQLTSIDDADWNRPQTYSVWVVRYDHKGKQVRTLLGQDLPTPPDRVGERTVPQYQAVAQMAVKSVSGNEAFGTSASDDSVKVFAGQRDDPFFVDTGSIFDLAGLRPFNTFHLLPLPTEKGVDGVSGFNVSSIALQVPIALIGKAPNAVLGVYASASRRAIRVLNEDADDGTAGQWVQVSRLGNPLVNEVLIPLGKKDVWNRQDPEDDAQFVQHFRNPELAGLVNLLYPALPDTPTTNREDLVTVLLTGIPNVNSTGPRKADLLRLNVSTPVTAKPNRLGALAGDFQGFPNGRRLADDVTDIELRAVACGYGSILQGALGLCNLSPNNAIGDGVDANERQFLPTFPYIARPSDGYDHDHDHGN